MTAFAGTLAFRLLVTFSCEGAVLPLSLGDDKANRPAIPEPHRTVALMTSHLILVRIAAPSIGFVVVVGS